MQGFNNENKNKERKVVLNGVVVALRLCSILAHKMPVDATW